MDRYRTTWATLARTLPPVASTLVWFSKSILRMVLSPILLRNSSQWRYKIRSLQWRRTRRLPKRQHQLQQQLRAQRLAKLYRL